MTSVKGRNRLPNPPARMTAVEVCFNYTLYCLPKFCQLAHQFDRDTDESRKTTMPVREGPSKKILFSPN